MKKMEDIVTRLYPVIFSDGFAYRESNACESACGNPTLLELRKNLVTTALRFNSANAKTKVTTPPETLTKFRPFNIKEIEFDIWDVADSKLNAQVS
jgi:hypothetical protein